MDLLDKNIEVTALYDIYQKILTEKQMNYFEAYYFDDLSITEISENMSVSRNAVHDQLKRTVKKLYDLEEKLEIHKNNKMRISIYEKIQSSTKDPKIIELVEECKKVE